MSMHTNFDWSFLEGIYT